MKKGNPPSEYRAFLHGAPGDVMCGIGHALKHPEIQKSGKFLYYGKDPSVGPFIRCQDFCKELIEVHPSSPYEYGWSVKTLCCLQRHHPQRMEMMRIIAERAGVPVESLLQFQISMEVKYTMEPEFWHSDNLPEEAKSWARSVIKNNGKPNILLHPYSFQSNNLSRHWPHWEMVLEWASQQRQFNWYLTGLGWKYHGKLGAMSDLIGQTPDNNYVLALFQLSDLAVTTSCNISHYATIIRKPVINGINAAVQNPAWYFRKGYNSETAMFVEFNEPFKKMMNLILGFFAGRHGTAPERALEEAIPFL